MDFPDVVAPIELALEQERLVTAQINELTRIAREESDFASDQFMQWFIKEQVEEVATMSALVTVVRRSKDNIEAIEDYIQREQEGTRPTPRLPVQGMRNSNPVMGPEGSGWLVRPVSGRVAELVLGHLLSLINVLGVLVFGLLVDHVPCLFHAGVNLVFLPAQRVLWLVEDAHRLATLEKRNDPTSFSPASGGGCTAQRSASAVCEAAPASRSAPALFVVARRGNNASAPSFSRRRRAIHRRSQPSAPHCGGDRSAGGPTVPSRAWLPPWFGGMPRTDAEPRWSMLTRCWSTEAWTSARLSRLRPSAEIRHHMVDLLDVSETATVAEFQQLARGAINDCRAREVIPIVVGGSALYVRAIVDDFEFLNGSGGASTAGARARHPRCRATPPASE